MESSIAEFLMRQLASERLPTSHACAPRALRARQNRCRHSLPHDKHCLLARDPHAQTPLPSAGRAAGSTERFEEWADCAATAALAPTPSKYTFSAFWL